MKAILACALLLATLPVHAQSLIGKVVGVSDGDTLTLRIEGQPQTRVRLSAIDAPEKTQAFGERAKQALSDLCFGKPAQADVVDVDRYGRQVAEVWCEGVYANGAMVQNGFAWVYRIYARNRADLYAAEADARLARRGLWVDESPTPPWDFRRAK